MTTKSFTEFHQKWKHFQERHHETGWRRRKASIFRKSCLWDLWSADNRKERNEPSCLSEPFANSFVQKSVEVTMEIILSAWHGQKTVLGESIFTQQNCKGNLLLTKCEVSASLLKQLLYLLTRASDSRLPTNAYLKKLLKKLRIFANFCYSKTKNKIDRKR